MTLQCKRCLAIVKVQFVTDTRLKDPCPGCGATDALKVKD